MKNLRVAMIVPPGISIPPKSFGGTERVVSNLVTGLMALDVEVDLYTVGESEQSTKIFSCYQHEQKDHYHKGFEESATPSVAHMLFSLNKIAEDGNYDIIHDHNMFVGPLALRWATEIKSMPPALHTTHGAYFTNEDTLSKGLPDYTPLWDGFSASSRSYIVGISEVQMRDAPSSLEPRTLPVVYNGVDMSQQKFMDKKEDYFLTLARMIPSKGISTAAKLCDEEGYVLKMAGSVDDMDDAAKIIQLMTSSVASPHPTESSLYFKRDILPYIQKNRKIEYIGGIGGEHKKDIIAGAKALLFPIIWDEPFGMAVVEALASGTPVIAMNRGAMPELIQHGVNGFLANNEEEFRSFMKRVDEIDPYACRQSVVERFSLEAMASAYLERYHMILEKAASEETR